MKKKYFFYLLVALFFVSSSKIYATNNSELFPSSRSISEVVTFDVEDLLNLKNIFIKKYGNKLSDLNNFIVVARYTDPDCKTSALIKTCSDVSPHIQLLTIAYNGGNFHTNNLNEVLLELSEYHLLSYSVNTFDEETFTNAIYSSPSYTSYGYGGTYTLSGGYYYESTNNNKAVVSSRYTYGDDWVILYSNSSFFLNNSTDPNEMFYSTEYNFNPSGSKDFVSDSNDIIDDNNLSWFEKIVSSIKKIPSALYNGILTIGGFFQDINNAIGGFFYDLILNIGGFCQNIIDSVGGFFYDSILTIGGFFQDINNSIAGFFYDAILDIGGFCQNIIDSITNLFVGDENSLRSFLSDSFNSIAISFNDKLGFVAQSITLVIDLFQYLMNLGTHISTNKIVNIPAIIEPFTGGTIYSGGSIDFGLILSQNNISTIYNIYLLFVDAFVCVSLLHLARREWESIVGMISSHRG